MKYVFKLLLLFFTLSAFSQSNRDSTLITSREWVNGNLDYMRFDKDTLIYNISGKKHKLYYDFGKKTLTLKEKYLFGGTQKKEEKISFWIKELSKDKLVLYPIDKKLDLDQETFYKLDYKPFYKKKQLVFYNRQNLVSRLKFDKITFHGSTCFGTCPSFSVEINRNGTVFYQGRIYTKPYVGNFIGKLSRADMIEFHKLLNRTQLRLIDRAWVQTTKPTDTPRYNYIIELSDGKTLEINTNDQHPVMDKLSNYFLAVPKKVTLTKIGRHQYERPSINNVDLVADIGNDDE